MQNQVIIGFFLIFSDLLQKNSPNSPNMQKRPQKCTFGGLFAGCFSPNPGCFLIHFCEKSDWRHTHPTHKCHGAVFAGCFRAVFRAVFWHYFHCLKNRQFPASGMCHMPTVKSPLLEPRSCLAYSSGHCQMVNHHPHGLARSVPMANGGTLPCSRTRLHPLPN